MRVNVVRRGAWALTVAGLVAVGANIPADTARATPSGRVYVGCGTSYSHCVALRRAYTKDGNRIGPLHFGHPGCTAVPESGCANENWFYVYR